MSFDRKVKNMESICNSADGFCFSPHPDNRGIIHVYGPMTVIPYSSDLNSEQLRKLFQIVYPTYDSMEIVADNVPGYDATILTGLTKEISEIISSQFPCAPLHSHLHDILQEIRKLSYSVIYAVRRESVTDIVAAGNGRIFFLNTIHMKDPYETVYYVVKVWKELGFRLEMDRIWLSGFGDCNENFIRNITLMTGENAICVL